MHSPRKEGAYEEEGKKEEDEEKEEEEEEDHEGARQELEKECLKLHGRLEQQSRMVITRMLTSQMALAFESFVHSVAHVKSHRLVCARILHHWTHRTSAAAFNCWHASTKEKRWIENICRGRVCSIHTLCVATAYDALVMNAQEARTRTRKVAGAVRIWRCLVLDRVFDTWLAYVALLQECDKLQHQKGQMGGATVAGDKDNDTMAMINKHAFSLAHTHTLCVLAESEWTRMVHSSTQRADRALTRRVFRRLCGCVAVRNTRRCRN